MLCCSFSMTLPCHLSRMDPLQAAMKNRSSEGLHSASVVLRKDISLHRRQLIMSGEVFIAAAGELCTKDEAQGTKLLGTLKCMSAQTEQHHWS